MTKKEEIKLRVMEAMQEEAYKGIVRIDSQDMRDIKIRPGDIVEIEGERKTVGIVDRAYPTDIGEAVIRMDGILRRNSKTGIGEYVNIRKIEVKEAKKVTIAPSQKGVVVRAESGMLNKSLLGRVVVKGDIISLGGSNRRRSTLSGTPFEEVFGDFFQEVFSSGFMGSMGSLKFVVADINPSKTPVIITENTKVTISSKTMEINEDSSIPDVTYEDIGGLDEEIKKVREMVELPLKHPELFEKLGIEPPKGILLYGSPGTGKTLLAKAVATETESNFILINGPEIMNKFYGESEKKIRKIFEDASDNAPSIIFIDELDAIAPKREETHGEVERRVVAQLLTLMDGLNKRGNVVVMAATNRPNSLDPALRRPGRFDREISFGVPDSKGRLIILKIHTRNMPLTKSINLKEVARITHGFVGADLESLSKEAAMYSLRRILPEINLKEKGRIPEEYLNKIRIGNDDFKEALKLVRPSAMREVLVEKPNVHWEDVGGLDSTKNELKEAVEWPMDHPEAFKRIGITPPKGILLYGPPGTGKTLLAKAVAGESESNFILVKGPELMSKWVGESEKGVRKIFAKARETAPTIILFDEIDSITSIVGQDTNESISRVVSQFLTEMDGLEDLSDVVVIGTTNRPDKVDPAFFRPGRFDRILHVPLPNKNGREEIFKVHTRKMKLSDDVKIRSIAESTEHYSGADMEAVCREAGMLALRADINAKEVTMADFKKAFKKIKPSITEEDIKKYTDIEEQYLRVARGAAIREVQNYMG
jgi:transitional endoplasmic reticulum ATPase